jgi:hypothetical protein
VLCCSVPALHTGLLMFNPFGVAEIVGWWVLCWVSGVLCCGGGVLCCSVPALHTGLLMFNPFGVAEIVGWWVLCWVGGVLCCDGGVLCWVGGVLCCSGGVLCWVGGVLCCSVPALHTGLLMFNPFGVAEIVGWCGYKCMCLL